MRLDYKKLAVARKNKGLTLGFAAEKIGVPACVLRKIENGLKTPSFESGRDNSFIASILKLYKIEIEELYYDKDFERIKNVNNII